MPTFSFRYSIYPEFFDQWPHFSQLSRYSSIIKMMALVKPMACENRSSVRDFDVIGSNSIGYWPRNLRLRGYWLFDGMGIGAKGVRNNLYVSMYLLLLQGHCQLVSLAASLPTGRQRTATPEQSWKTCRFTFYGLRGEIITMRFFFNVSFKWLKNWNV